MATENSATSSTPFLHPAPGRCVVRIVPRLGETATESGVILATDTRYENQPMVGVLLVIGDPRNESERVICEWAAKEADAGHLFVFSQYGTGSPYWNEEMKKMLPIGYDFRWLQGLRLYDIGQLGATIEGAGAYGELIAPEPKLVTLQ